MHGSISILILPFFLHIAEYCLDDEFFACWTKGIFQVTDTKDPSRFGKNWRRTHRSNEIQTDKGKQHIMDVLNNHATVHGQLVQSHAKVDGKNQTIMWHHQNHSLQPGAHLRATQTLGQSSKPMEQIWSLLCVAQLPLRSIILLPLEMV